MKLFGLPFVAIGLFMIVGRFFADAERRAHTLYGVTSNRVFIVTGRGKTVASYPLAQIPGITTTEGRDGFGSVLLASATPALAQLGSVMAATTRRGVFPMLEMIESPKLVAETITRAQREAAAHKS